MVDSSQNYSLLFNHSLFFLKFRPRTEKEVSDNLQKFARKLKLEETLLAQLIEKIIDRLKELKFIDDADFIRYWLEKRFRFNPRGERILKVELRQKGISSQLLDEIFPLEIKKFSSKQQVSNLVDKAMIKYQYLEYYQKKKKLLDYLIRRGFSYNEAVDIIDERLKKQ